MFHHKKHLFFDLDHTLWDYEVNSEETLGELWEKYQLSAKKVALPQFVETFNKINDEMWDSFHEGVISKERIRIERFPKIYSALDIDDTSGAETMQAEYITVCPTKPNLVDGVSELLDLVDGKYELHIITNGFDEIQGTKLRSGGIEKYFTHIISSGEVGFQKPDKKIFDYALKLANATAEDSLMIGDNPISDIKGAYMAGIDQVFYNPHGLACSVNPTKEVKSMRELLNCF